jgi:hypothetical protein
MVDNVTAYEVLTGRVPGAAGAPVDTVTAPDGQVYGNTSGIPAAEPAAQSAGIEGASAQPAGDGITIDVELGDAPAQQPAASEAPAAKKTKKAAAAEPVEEDGGSAIGDLADSLLGRSGTRQVIRSTGGTIGREIGKTIGEAVLGKKGRTIGGNIGSSIGRNLFGTLTSKRR